MRCKVGDLAMILRSTLGNEGRVVEVAKFLGDLTPTTKPRLMRNCWGVRGHVISSPLNDEWVAYHGIDGFFEDDALRPIRDQPGEDEMLRITGKPQETPTEIIRRETERVS